jgi:hypothetical protein
MIQVKFYCSPCLANTIISVLLQLYCVSPGCRATPQKVTMQVVDNKGYATIDREKRYIKPPDSECPMMH